MMVLSGVKHSFDFGARDAFIRALGGGFVSGVPVLAVWTFIRCERAVLFVFGAAGNAAHVLDDLDGLRFGVLNFVSAAAVF